MYEFFYLLFLFYFFFFKQKTAYEMRISDWSSDVCSSDLVALRAAALRDDFAAFEEQVADPDGFVEQPAGVRSQIEDPAARRLAQRFFDRHHRGLEVGGRVGREIGDGEHADVAADFPFHGFQDRKSTRLNSSH